MKVSEFNSIKKFSEASGSCAVESDKIAMELNEFGIYEEIISLDENVELDSDILFVSPSFNEKVDESDLADKLFKYVHGIQYDKRLGYFLSLYAGHVREGQYRKNASSGGMGTWIFKELFERDLIDGVIHVKENQDKNSSVLFKYDISSVFGKHESSRRGS